MSPRSPKKMLALLSTSLTASPTSKNKKIFSLPLHNGRSGRKLPNLAELLQEKDFESISDILLDPQSVKYAANWFDAECSMTGENCLHSLVKSRPSASLVSLMLQRLKKYGVDEPELSIDDLGQTPLHHAIASCCSPNVIRAILETASDGQTSVLAQDCRGRIPLHLAMRPYGLFCRNESTRLLRQDHAELRGTMRATIEILVKVCPQTLLVADDNDCTPLDLARAVYFDKFFVAWMDTLAHAVLRESYEETLTIGLPLEIQRDLWTDDDVSALTLVY